MLIYAFRDAQGTWHGDPDAVIDEARPGRGILALPPTAAGQDPGLFDDQRLEVLYGTCDLEASQSVYRLDGGDTLLATWRVHELLSPAYRLPASRPDTASQAPPEVKLEIAGPRRRYSLSADRLAEGRVEVTVIICTTDGIIQGELTGELDTGDLADVGRLITSAALACEPEPSTVPADPPTSAVKATRPGQAWTSEAVAHLREGHREGKSVTQLAEELGRSEKSIRFKLSGLRLSPFPHDLVSAPRFPARTEPEPEPPKAYTVEEKRRLHPNAYKPWEPHDDQRLAELCAQGASLDELAQEFGRNEGAIASRLEKINAEGPAVEAQQL